MTGNGNHTTYKHVADWGMVGLWYCFTHITQYESIIFAFPWHGMDDHEVCTMFWPQHESDQTYRSILNRDVPANDERQKGSTVFGIRWNYIESIGLDYDSF